MKFGKDFKEISNALHGTKSARKCEIRAMNFIGRYRKGRSQDKEIYDILKPVDAMEKYELKK